MDRPLPERVFDADNLRVEVYRSQELAGQAAALDVGARIESTLETKEILSMVLAAAPSQDDFLAALSIMPKIAWTQVVALHMDEYISMPESHPQRFGNYLRERLFDLVRPGVVHYLDGNALDLEEECRRYASLWSQHPPDVVCLGIGENGHIAFNDPDVADFRDPAVVKVVELDEQCRQQQVNDGCFSRIESVPTQALTMTIPALMSGNWMYCIVPGARKAEAVRETLHGPISERCPASILRKHDRAVLYLDLDSARLLSLGRR
jgi:glucosamine-6-phosphate deaminase